MTDGEHFIHRSNTPWRVLAWGGAAVLLLTPAVAMRFTSEVQWTAFDFAFFGGLLLIVCGGFEFLLARAVNLAYRFAAAIALGAAFLMIWANAAVGIIGSEDNPANLMYAGVLAVGVIGAILARFRARGMARAMAATVGALFVVFLAAVLGHVGDPVETVKPVQLFEITVFFAFLWALSAALFARAARDQADVAAGFRR